MSSIFMIGSGPAWAKSTVQPGSVSCGTITGSFKFNPPLTAAGGASSETVTTKSTATNCTATGGGLTPTKGTTTVISSGTSNKCATVLMGAAKPQTLTTKWAPGTIAPTVVNFPPATTAQGPPIVISFGGSGTTGTGSYTTTDGGKASTAQITLGQTVAQLTASCTSKKGLKTITIVSGHATTK